MSHESAAVVGGGKTPRERILLNPHDYIGSVEKCTRKIWVLDDASMAHRMVTYVPGLFKIFDEILVYAADNKQRDPGMDSLNVVVDVAECRISICYNGHGVPIELHPEEGVYMPETIFGNLSSCEEIASGRNSCSVKLANLFSTEFVIETVDSRFLKKYKQVFTENMGKKTEPEITDCLLGGNWMKITFKPDLAKFHMTQFDNDAIALMRRRVADIVGFLGITVQVMFNGRIFQRVKGFPNYVVAYMSAAYKGTGW